MNKLILSFIFLFFISSAFGRNFEFGINTGIADNTAPINHLITGEYNSKGSGIKPIFAAEGNYRFRSWKFGLSASYTKIYYYPKITQLDFDYASSYSSGEEWITYGSNKVSLAQSVLPVSLTVNRLINIGKAELFAGAAMGYCLGNNETSTSTMKLNGYTLGLNLGCAYRLYKHFGVKAQLQGNYINLKNTDKHYQHFSVFDFPLTAGVFYSL